MNSTRILKVLASARAWWTNGRTIGSTAAGTAVKTEPRWILNPLTPQYIELEHGPYVEAINAALEDPEILNIALSGNYGVGKSSILKKFAESQNHRVVELSMSTLAPTKRPELDKDSPQHASTPTNRIQQEIVKQLLYREAPHKTPESRFHRIESFNLKLELAFAACAGLTIASIFLLSGWSTKIAKEIYFLNDVGSWVHLLVFALSSLLVFSLRKIFHGKVQIKQLSAGSAVVNLDEKSPSYFDQYLDEIVYFFEKSSHNIVIFEDIDRFNDSRIFEALRSLNTLLNSSPQTNRPIRFVYATKDSIFELPKHQRADDPAYDGIGEIAHSEAFRANRTKFFDLVIPVVPFITHQSAKNLAIKLLRGVDHDVKIELIDLTTRHIPDMRLLKNVVNEFVIFKDRIFHGDGKELRLKETGLFAMMLFKSTHISDFESIHLGKSKLDELYAAHRNLVTSNIKIIEHKLTEVRRKIALHNSLSKRSEKLGELLISQLGIIVSALKRSNPALNQNQFRYFINRDEKSESDLCSVEFWREIAEKTQDTVLNLKSNYRAADGLSLSKSEIEAIIDQSLETSDWKDFDLDQMKAELEDMNSDLVFLRRSDMGEVIKRQDFKVNHGGSEKTLNEIAHELLQSELACSLVREGFIDRNFTLYTATFHDTRVSASAMNFLIHHLDSDLMDEHFQLSDEDVDAIIRERGLSALSYSAAYNINIVDFLLREKPTDESDTVIRNLAKLGEKERRFNQAYVYTGLMLNKFASRLIRFTSEALIYFICELDCDNATRIEIVDSSLANLRSGIKYKINNSVVEYLKAFYADFVTLTSDKVEPSVLEQVGDLFSEGLIRIDRLAPLSCAAKEVFLYKNLYSITLQNLQIAVPDAPTLSLNSIRGSNSNVYNYVLEDIESYLSETQKISFAIDEDSAFTEVVGDVVGRSLDALPEVIDNSSSDCLITNLEDISEEAWPSLAKHKRFSASPHNILLYISAIGSIDDDLARLLTEAQRFSDWSSIDENAKKQLAKKVLEASDTLTSSGFRAQLVASLELEGPLDFDDIPDEPGELYGALVERSLIPDDAETYEELTELDWPTRENFINKSSKFVEYMTPALLEIDLASLFNSKIVGATVKDTVLRESDSYIQVAHFDGCAQMAKYAIRNEVSLTKNTIKVMSEIGIPASHLVELMQPYLGAPDKDWLYAVLRNIGGEYAELTVPGRGKLKISDTKSNIELLRSLKRYGIITQFPEKWGTLRVHRRYSEPK